MMKTLWSKEPTLLIAAAQTVLALAVAFGLGLSAVQEGALLAALAAVLGLVTRSQVSSVAALKELAADTPPPPAPPAPAPPPGPVDIRDKPLGG
jgi:hypothetical protein